MPKTNFIVEPGTNEVVVTHTFDHAPDAVYAAYTDPEAIVKWWGPRTLRTKIDKMEIRTGGLRRIVQTDADGKEFAFHGVYHLLERPSQIVDTFEFEGIPGHHVLLETVTFEEEDGKTRVTVKSVYQSVEDRDGMVASGMESGATDSMERLGELLDMSKSTV